MDVLAVEMPSLHYKYVDIVVDPSNAPMQFIHAW